MAELVIYKERILKNIRTLNTYFEKHGITWTLIVKMLSGNKRLLKEILTDPILSGALQSVGDSRLTGLRHVKELNPEIQTMYIKPPAIRFADQVVTYADVSLNSSFRTIEALNRAAGKQNKVHKVIIMIEMGELREGILGDNLIDFYTRVFALEHIDIIGIGTNLGCLFGVEPTRDKLVQLSLYKQLIEATFKTKVSLVSGGTSITLPVIEQGKLPKAVNHFRVGEAVFMGTSPLDQKRFSTLSESVFEYDAQILEIEEKDAQPDGVIGEGNIGHAIEAQEDDPSDKSFRALVDFGLIDVDAADLEPLDPEVSLFGSTSDMTVYSLGSNKTPSGQKKYQVGQSLPFKPSYMAVARLMSSKFIDKRVV
ncbi:alanine racemase [Spirochaeta lutea]|uniref:Alanine racemase N-terminal domain-containing protein n=1 Tax=Spirochaeta lutea TaxID=1480694 RepID=A0A098QTA7_9SPIO|nr:alanine racemase [Spirochaeta lutea]KGE70791.1 hypothetical protein DC28_14970 [Spirochaeta lutea]